ncbi:unnamed protein product [Ixodes pacificus]
MSNFISQLLLIEICFMQSSFEVYHKPKLKHCLRQALLLLHHHRRGLPLQTATLCGWQAAVQGCVFSALSAVSYIRRCLMDCLGSCFLIKRLGQRTNIFLCWSGVTFFHVCK